MPAKDLDRTWARAQAYCTLLQDMATASSREQNRAVSEAAATLQEFRARTAEGLPDVMRLKLLQHNKAV